MNPNMKLMLSLFLALAAAMEISAAPCHAACPPFWVPFQESCYGVFGTKLNWQDAENACHTHFNEFEVAHLVSFRNEAERLFVHELWELATGNMVALHDHTFWMGLTDADTEGNWVWTDNNEVATYTAWKPGQPSNSHASGEHCGHETSGNPSSPTWNDWVCGNQLYYVCEIPQAM